MNTDRIQNKIHTLFSDHSRWQHSGRRLVFWYDAEGQFAETFQELQLEGIEKLQLGDTPFTTKYHLLIEKPDTPFLLYAPYPEPAWEDNGLLDLQLTGLPFSADQPALIFADLGFKQRSFENVIRHRIKFFNNKKRTEALQNMALPPDTDERGLLLAMLSVLAGLKVPDASALIRQVLIKGLLESDNPLWQEIIKFLPPEDFWQIVSHQTRFSDATPSLHKLFVQLMVTHFEKSLQGSVPSALAQHLITPGQQAYAFIDQWMRDQQDAPGWKLLSQQIADELQIQDKTYKLSPAVLQEAATFEVIDQILIRACIHALKTPEDITPWREWLQTRRTLFWYEKYQHHYSALNAAITLLELHQQYKKRLRMSAEELFQAYADDLYRFDQAYRHFIVASDAAFGDILKELIETIENLYTQWYLEELGQAWSDSVGDSWQLDSVPPQNNFFGRYVLPILEKNDREKAFIIISDAMRYEVAAELQEVIQKEIRGQITLEPMFGELPSVTKLGMAALLPGSGLELLPGKSDVLRDGRSTQGSFARGLVLNEKGKVSATVIQADELLAMKAEQGREAILPHRLIYIYHNHIDAVGDKAASEAGVFAACRDTLEQLMRLVKKICNSLNGTHVMLTADHGFLYQRRPMTEAEKLPLLKGEEVLETNRRYVLGHHLTPEPGTKAFFLPHSGLTAIVPRGSLRFAIQGTGSQFVHGGASLQEVCVPVITYHHQRANQSDEGLVRKVGVQVNAKMRKVTNNRFNLSVVQTEAVIGRARSRQVTVALYDPNSLTAITDIPKAELNSTSPKPSEREYSLRLTITTPNPPATAYLIIRDADDESELIRETWTVNLGIVNDFGDF